MAPSAELLEQTQPTDSFDELGMTQAEVAAVTAEVEAVRRLEGYGNWSPYSARVHRQSNANSATAPSSAVEVVSTTGTVSAAVTGNADDTDSSRDRSYNLVASALDAATTCALQCSDALCRSDDGTDANTGNARFETSGSEREEHTAAGDDECPGPVFMGHGMEGDLVGAAQRSVLDDQERSLSKDSASSKSVEDIGKRMVAETAVRTATALAATTMRKSEVKRSTGKPTRVLKPDVRDLEGHTCPVHWFVADDMRSHIRYFSLQGSDSMESWKTNLAFDPVEFEDPDLGVQVHRGMYEAALAAYYRFVPMIQEHLATSPFARVCFTGHSLGGSISVILALMLVHRKVLRPMQLAPVYTFGAAAMFCEGHDLHEMQSGDTASLGGSLLRRIGLPVDSIRNVILTNDIVPRAFACDYSRLNVARVLRRLAPFNGHSGLHLDDRSIMYNFVGRVVVLQPSESMSWVKSESEANHPLLPRGPGLYELCEPDNRFQTGLSLASLDSMDSYLDSSDSLDMLEGFMPTNKPRRRQKTAGGGIVEGYTSALTDGASQKRIAYFQSVLGDAGSHVAYRLADLHEATSRSARVVHLNSSRPQTFDFGSSSNLASLDLFEYAEAAASSALAPETSSDASDARVHSLHHATLALFDSPHPLVVLANQSAYGDHGIISRFHHPDHYTRALGSVLRSNLAPMRILSKTMNPERVIAAMKSGLRKTRMRNRIFQQQRFSWGLEAVAVARVRKHLHLCPEGTLFTTSLGPADFWGQARESSSPGAAR